MSFGSDPKPAGACPYSARDAREVVRYYLGSVQLEEALSARPRARRAIHAGLRAPRVDAPTPGQEYFKLPLDAAFAALASGAGELAKPLDPELAAFFEHYLVARYQRGEDDKELGYLVAFPAVHLPRGELAGLLRYGVDLTFADDAGREFVVPTRSQRKRREYPLPPTRVRLRPAEHTSRQLPFFLDTRLLNQQLGVPRESIDALFSALNELPELTERTMLVVICRFLSRELELARTQRDATPEQAQTAGAEQLRDAASSMADLIGQLTAVTEQLLRLRGGKARSYPVALALDATRAKATFHLQRELEALLEDENDRTFATDRCLGAYLRGSSPPAGRAVQHTLFPGPPLSSSQRAAAEAFWGSRLTAVQGPPGTGKTTLILHLAAQAIVTRVAELAHGRPLGAGLFVVASTNNRAVDNVVDPLIELAGPGLPLALRAGSRLICEQVLGPQLARAAAFLKTALSRPRAERSAALEAALAQFRSYEQELKAALAPRVRAFEQDNERARVLRELSQLAAQAEAGETPELRALDAAQRNALRETVAQALKRIDRLCELCEVAPSLPALNAIDRAFRKADRREISQLRDALARNAVPLELELPPALPPSTDPERLMTTWGDAVDRAATQLEGLTRALDAARDAQLHAERRRKLERQLERLAIVAPPATAAHDLPPDDLQRALFTAAIAVRTAYAEHHAEELAPLVSAAADAAQHEGSLRSIVSDPTLFAHFSRLFPVWGCTLLSLSNCLPIRADTIAELVIDEAGQCHPAYALGALLRSGRTLIIGDVHQLEPVIDLEPADDERLVQALSLKLSQTALAPYRVHANAQCSVQRLADRAVGERLSLVEHFRCQREIIAVCDRLCNYGLHIETPAQNPSQPLPELPNQLSLIATRGEQQRLGGSYCNPVELNTCLSLVRYLLDAGISPDELAVITPYRGQLERLRRAFAEAGIAVDRSVELQEFDDPIAGATRGVGLGTVHRFQGGERSIVLFSSVVTRATSLPFLDQRPNLLNVAISRARHRFIAIGDRDLLARGRRTRLLVQAATEISWPSRSGELF